MASETENTETKSVNPQAKTEFNNKIMQDRADKLTDVLIETFGFTNTTLLLSHALGLTEQKMLKHHGVYNLDGLIIESEEQND